MKNIAILLAGGTGSRMGLDLPKQFLRLGARTVLEHSVAAFEAHPLIHEIVVVANADYLELTRSVLARAGFAKLRHVTAGGRERYHSTMAALALYRDAPEAESINLIFHDAVRPLVSQAVISRVTAALARHEAVAVAVPSVDTLFEVDGEGCLARIPPRALMRCAQTPQAFRLPVVARAYERAAAAADGFRPTDDCGTVMRYVPEVKIHIVEGDVGNVKLTYKEQIASLERALGASGGA